MSRDPIRDGWNWHAYVGGDPVNYVDPWGLSPTNNETDSNINWGQVTMGTVNVVGGIAATVVVVNNPATAVVAFETIALTAYGAAQIATGFSGEEIPSATDFMIERASMGFARTDFDK